MRIQQMQPQTGLAAPTAHINNVRVDSSAAVARAKSEGQLGNAIIGGVNAYIQQRQVAEVMEANNFYNARMGEEMAKLSQKKEGAALNIVDDYDAAAQKVREQTEKKYGKYMWGEQGKALAATMTRDTQAKRNQMVNYQIAETEKYMTTQYGNTLEDISQQLANGYTDPDTVSYFMDKAKTAAAAFAFTHGDEAIKQAQRKAASFAVSSALDAASSKEDWGNANKIFQQYSDSMDSKTRAQWAKVINAKQLASNRATTYNGIYRQGMTEAEFMQAFEAGIGNLAYDNTSLLKTAEQHIGENKGVNNNCTTFVNQCLTANGYKAVSLYAPDQMAGGNYQTDPSGLRDGDIIYQDVDGEETVDGKPDPDHVGIYNAATNSVIQSGVEGGVQYIPMSTYKMLGYIHPEKVEMTPGQREEEMDKARAWYRKQNSAYRADQNQAISDGRDDMYNMWLENPAVSLDEMRAYAIQRGNGDKHVTVALMQSADVLARRAGSGSKGQKFTETDASAYAEALKMGELKPDELRALIRDGSWDQTAIEKVDRLVEQYESGTGRFDQKWDGLWSSVFSGGGMGSYSASDRAMLKRGAEPYCIAYYNETMKQTGRPPTDDEMIKYAQSVIIDKVTYGKGIFGDKTISKASLGAKGIVKLEQGGDGRYYATLKGKSNPVVMTSAQLTRVIEDGANPYDVIGR